MVESKDAEVRLIDCIEGLNPQRLGWYESWLDGKSAQGKKGAPGKNGRRGDPGVDALHQGSQGANGKRGRDGADGGAVGTNGAHSATVDANGTSALSAIRYKRR